MRLTSRRQKITTAATFCSRVLCAAAALRESPRTHVVQRPIRDPTSTGRDLHFVYTGNVHDRRGGSTFCPACGHLLIERDWYRLGAYNLVEGGRCDRCGETCPGHFDPTPGHWGAKRLPVSFAGR